MKVQSFTCNPFQELCYVLWDESTRRCIIVDPGMCSDWEWQRVHRFLEDKALTPDRVLLTHCHSDHVMGTGYVKHAYPTVPICGAVDDQNHLPDIQSQNGLFGVDVEIHWTPITQNLLEGDTFLFPSETGEEQVARVIDCPGHSHHGLCYYFPADKILMSGDVLFCCSVGRSDFGPAMGGNGRLLVEGIVSKLLTLPADVTVYPGHGPMTNIGYESTYNPYL